MALTLTFSYKTFGLQAAFWGLRNHRSRKAETVKAEMWISFAFTHKHSLVKISFRSQCEPMVGIAKFYSVLV